jgi:hypothetical protein
MSADERDRGDLIQLFHFLPLLLKLKLVPLAVFQFLQHSHLAIRLRQDLPTAVNFRSNLLFLEAELCQPRFQNRFVSVDMHYAIDVGTSRLRQFPRQLLILLQFLRKLLPALFEHLRGSQGFGKLSPPLITFSDAEPKHSLETEAEHGSREVRMTKFE